MYLAAKSYFSRSIPQLLQRLGKLESTLDLQSQTVLFSISPAASCSNSSLTDLVTRFTSLPSSVGCLSAPVNLIKSSKSTRIVESDYTLCSVAVFDSQTTIPFRSTVPGKEVTQVGRWHAFRKAKDIKLDDHRLPREGSEVDWESVWAQKKTQPELPEELKYLSPKDVETVVYLSDQAPEGLCHSLEPFSYASKIGLIAHSTPFLTGRPFTMFYGRRIFSSGAVGLCIRHTTDLPASVSLHFPELHPVTPVLTVTDSEGNLVHSIDDANPSQLLLNAIVNIEGSAKEDTYFIGVQDLESPSSNLPSGQLFSIMSGDPSRGTVALEAEKAPGPGTKIRIYRRPSGVQPFVSLQRGLNLCTANAEGIDLELKDTGSSDDIIELDDAFLAASENGILVSRRTAHLPRCEETWKSALRGGSVAVRWP